MNWHRKGFSAFALMLVAPTFAGVDVGQKAPPLEPKSFENTTLKSLDALKGKVVLYEFFAYW